MSASLDRQAKRRVLTARLSITGFTLVLVGFACAYRLLVAGRLEQSAALFIGLPAALAIAFAWIPRTGTATGNIVIGITIALGMSGVFLGEGFICILMAAPLAYLIGIAIGISLDLAAVDRRRGSALLLVPFLPLSLEGTHEALSFERRESVTVERTVSAGADEVYDSLAQAPAFEGELPFFLQLGFPRPVEVRGASAAVGDRITVRFAGGEGEPGDLVLELVERRPGLMIWRAREDTSHVAHWLDWREARMEWTEIAPGRTEVRCTLRYDRLLDPAWYFRPIERYAVGLAGRYLIDSLVSERGEG